MDSLFSTAKGLATTKFRYDDDSTDRWHHFYTSIILVIFSIVVSTKQYVGSAIVCWPHSYAAGHKDYIHDYCWISNTYWLPLNDHIPKDHHERADRELAYYQWVPFYFLLIAVMFYLPCMLWRVIADTSAINIKDIVDAAISQTTGDPDERKKTIGYLVKHIDHCLIRQREMKETNVVAWFRYYLKCLLVCGRRYGNFLFITYMLVKVLYLANVIGQIFLLNAFLGTGSKFTMHDSFTMYGWRLANDLFNKHFWRTSGWFPRVTMCDFQVRVLGNLHNHTVQCVLPINMFNEKIFVFLWFFFFLLALITLFNILVWINDMFYLRKYQFVKKYLRVWKLYSKTADKELFHRFMNVYLRTDGVFCLRLIYKNTGELIVGDIIRKLWEDYQTKDKLAKLFSSKPDRQRQSPSMFPFKKS